jgi:polyphenol oxidase
MPFYQLDQIRYFTFESFEDAGVTHGIITRRGGTSPEPWHSLNVGGTVGDDAERVLENRKRSFRALDRPFASLYDVWQVHGREVVYAQAPRPLDEPHLRADAILSDQPGITLFMRFADCVPVFLYDPLHHVAGLVHAGWQGTVQHTAASAVTSMQQRYATRPQDILAGIGPSIGRHHYEVGGEIVEQVQLAFGELAAQVLYSVNGANGRPSAQFDLWAANRLVLEQAGVRQIEVAEICTACNLDDWYSHRAEKGRTGRFGALIGL